MIRELREASSKHENEPLGITFLRYLSIYPTALFIKMRLAPNFISWLSIIITITGGVLLGFGSHRYFVMGAVVLLISLIIDCSDGEVARYTGKLTPYGFYLEGLGGNIDFVAVFAGLGIGVYRLSGDIILLGFAMSALCFKLLYRQCSARYVQVLESMKASPRYSPLGLDKKSPTYKRVLNAGYTSLYSPDGVFLLLLLFAIINKTDLYLMFYGTYLPLMFLAYNFYYWLNIRR